MALDILKERGIPLDRQSFNWRDLVQVPFSKLDDAASDLAADLRRLMVQPAPCAC